ncbi:MAG: hypothetical protein HC828_02115 [Blastochloris sp.]|nr:hypothetical protein [Blastochloris sp.]
MAPTRSQIEADVRQPQLQVEIRPAGSWIDVSSFVAGVQQDEATAGDVSGVAFGTSVGLRADVEVDIGAHGYAAYLTPIWINYGFNGSTKLRRYVGVIMRERWDGRSGSWQTRGVDALLEGTPIRSPLFRRRPIATAITLSSIEDPTNANYRGGLYNYICWQAGGRPWEQAASYPDAPFYYAADQAPIAPEWSWIHAENAWEELHRLCQAAGGQVYQDNDGVLRYIDPLRLILASPTYTYTDAVLTAAQRVSQNASGFEGVSRDTDLEHTVSAFTCTFIERNLDGTQVVYEDTTPRRIGADGQANDVLTLDLDTQLPVYRVSRIELEAAHIRTGQKLTDSQVTVAITATAAQRISVTITNTTNRPAQIRTIRVWGRPVVAGEEGSVTSTGSSSLASTRVLPLQSNVYIQSREHAERLVQMAYDFYAEPRPIITLRGCAYDPDRAIGERVALTYAPWGYSALACRIVAKRPTNGRTMEVDLQPISGLPIASNFFQFGVTYAGSDTRELAY